MDFKPLAEKIRPQTFSDIIGQDYLVGEDGIITRMLNKNKLVSIILYGNPGVGKTTIAKIIGSMYELESYFFSASSDTKATLKDIIQGSKMYRSIILIIDEIHRMNKDIQDYLLSFMESGKIIVIGMTTVNPYISVNPAIRSRCNIYRLNDLKPEEIKNYLIKITEKLENQTIKIDENVYEFIANSCGNELRVAINNLELIDSVSKENEHITLEYAQKLIDVYPDMKLSYNDNKIVFPDGTAIIYDDGKEKSFDINFTKKRFGFADRISLFFIHSCIDNSFRYNNLITALHFLCSS